MYTKIKAFFDRSPIGLTAQAFLYPLLLFAALIFAQLSKTPLSHGIFTFVLLLPLGAAVQLGVALFSVRASVRMAEKTVEKRRLTTFFASVSNRGPIPLAFVEAQLILPGEGGSRTLPQRVMMSLLPFSQCRIERGVEFAYRGEYDVGISHVYVYDLSRSVRLRINLSELQRVFVLPRRLTLAPREICGEEYSASLAALPTGADNTEPSDTRIYVPGDNLKRIHWKLTGKSEDIIVKDDAARVGAHIRIMCDLEPYYSSGHSEGLPALRQESKESADLIGADAVVEIALAAALRELQAGNRVTLAWVERGKPTSLLLTSVTDYNAAFRRFASALLDPVEGHVLKLASEYSSDTDALPVIVCPAISQKRAKEYASLFGNVKHPSVPEIYIGAHESIFIFDENARREEKTAVRTLMSAGFNVIKHRP